MPTDLTPRAGVLLSEYFRILGQSNGVSEILCS